MDCISNDGNWSEYDLIWYFTIVLTEDGSCSLRYFSFIWHWGSRSLFATRAGYRNGSKYIGVVCHARWVPRYYLLLYRMREFLFWCWLFVGHVDQVWGNWVSLFPHVFFPIEFSEGGFGGLTSSLCYFIPHFIEDFLREDSFCFLVWDLTWRGEMFIFQEFNVHLSLSFLQHLIDDKCCDRVFLRFDRRLDNVWVRLSFGKEILISLHVWGLNWVSSKMSNRVQMCHSLSPNRLCIFQHTSSDENAFETRE